MGVIYVWKLARDNMVSIRSKSEQRRACDSSHGKGKT